MDNLEEMDKFLEKYNLTKLNQELIEKLNRASKCLKIKTATKDIPTNKSPGPNGFTVEFYQKFRVEITSVLIKLFQKVTEEGKLSNSF